MQWTWNPELYREQHDFVYKFGEEVVALLNPSKDETILDLGCGTGDLTHRISELCRQVIGIDASAEMIRAAHQKYERLALYHKDARDFELDHQFDAVFSNSVLHWIPEQEMVIKNINSHLKPGGRFVTEFGGKGCVHKILGGITETLDSSGVDYPPVERFLYYPSVSEYSSLLEKSGFEVSLAMLFDRPTELEGGRGGLNNFIEMFFSWFFEKVSPLEKEGLITRIEKRLETELFNDSSWVADYRRIRIMAIKTSDASAASL